MSFNFSVVTKEGVELEESSTIYKLLELYIDFYNYTANKINWEEVRESLSSKREYLKSQGILVTADDDPLETSIAFDEEK